MFIQWNAKYRNFKIRREINKIIYNRILDYKLAAFKIIKFDDSSFLQERANLRKWVSIRNIYISYTCVRILLR